MAHNTGKVKTTRREIVNSNTNIISIGYCAAQTLLRNHSPFAYTSGVYGWNFDAYYIDGVTICTGYRGMPGRTVANVDAYEARANAIMRDYNRSYEERSAEIDALLHEFLSQA